MILKPGSMWMSYEDALEKAMWIESTTILPVIAGALQVFNNALHSVFNVKYACELKNTQCDT